MPDPSSRRLRVPTGLEIHALEWGADRPDLDHTVLLLHGFLDLAWGWNHVVEAGLMQRFHVVAIDLRGHGDSDRVGAGGYYHFMDYLADVAGVVDLVRRSRISLVGHSMGGSVAAYYSGAYPERVHRLALLEGVGPPEDPTPIPDRVLAWVDAWGRVRGRSQRGYPNVATAAERLRQHDSQLDPALALWLAERGTRRLPDGSLAFKHDPLHGTRGPYPFREQVAAEFWARIRCPVLAVDGSESAFLGMAEAVELRLAHLPRVERARIDGAGHMLQRHRPRELAALLVDFLSR